MLNDFTGSYSTIYLKENLNNTATFGLLTKKNRVHLHSFNINYFNKLVKASLFFAPELPYTTAGLLIKNDSAKYDIIGVDSPFLARF